MTMRRQDGFTLLEVLVTMLLISFCLLGIAGIIANGMKANYSSYGRSQASWLANDIIERMRANRVTAEGAGAPYDLGVADSLNMNDTANVPKADLVAWRSALANSLPSGTGGVSLDTTTKKVTVTIQWNDARAAGGSATQQFVIESRL